MPAILGINAFHGDASACMILDGKVVAAAEEERGLAIIVVYYRNASTIDVEKIQSLKG